ncbi:TetR/AcrR family transcriptional regulator [Prauserella marina]|uniref:TetR/AcrR family transcriptional regulator n=1 Tax=Prauserella marina TaxID=530584 RepID=UPI001B87E4A7|nr:TetR/AcrR family transcriptional regulator [Prauserella marina]
MGTDAGTESEKHDVEFSKAVTAQTAQPPWRTKAKAPRRLPRQPLSQESIVDAALTVLDRDGLAAVSMRGTAQELGTGPASLYAHVADKSELLDLLLERVFGEIALPRRIPGGWRLELRALALEIRRALTTHAGIARVAMLGAPTGPNGLRVGEAILDIMLSAGFRPRVCALTADRLVLYVAADVLDGALYPGDPAGREQVGGYLRNLPAERFPHTVAMADDLLAREPIERFEFGLGLMLDGLAAREGRGR